MDSIKTLEAVNLAIWIRDHSGTATKESLLASILELSSYDLFSNRQLAKICRNRISYPTIRKYTLKNNKSGGRINPNSLEEIRDILYARHNGVNNYNLIKIVLEDGTSQGMISKLTGVPQSSISKNIGGK